MNINKQIRCFYSIVKTPFRIQSMLCIESEASYDGISTAMPIGVKEKLAQIKSNIGDDSIFQTVYGGNHTYNTIPNVSLQIEHTPLSSTLFVMKKPIR